MLQRLRPRLTFANVTSCVALFVALGGGAYAATQLPKNSVGPKQIRKNAVNASKVRKNAINGSKVRSNSLTGADIKLSKLGTVPSARSAATAGTANVANVANVATTATNADHAKSADSAPLPETLASGRTAKGVWSVVDFASALNQVYVATISFPVPLASAPTAHLVGAGQPPPAGCSGSVDAPAADPGHLCVFETFGPINLKFFGFYDPETETESATTSGRLGALPVFESNAGGEVQALGTFAVTAG